MCHIAGIRISPDYFGCSQGNNADSASLKLHRGLHQKNYNRRPSRAPTKPAVVQPTTSPTWEPGTAWTLGEVELTAGGNGSGDAGMLTGAGEVALVTGGVTLVTGGVALVTGGVALVTGGVARTGATDGTSAEAGRRRHPTVQ